MPTPHLEAQPGDFAPTVLLPGDPLRAQHIAETYLQNTRTINRVRNMLAYTGTYHGTPISVMGSGMGIPSISIYAKELITEYHVQNLIRVGSCGAVSRNIQIRDILIAQGACTDSQVNRIRYGGFDYSPIADFHLLRTMVQTAERLNIPTKVGNLHSADLFYNPQTEIFNLMETMNILGVEMEAAGLYGCAAEHGARALAICTVSDHIRTGESTTSAERQTTFHDMIHLTLETVASLEHNQT